MDGAAVGIAVNPKGRLSIAFLIVLWISGILLLLAAGASAFVDRIEESYHFGGALAISAIMTAPWPTLSAIAVAIRLFGLGGLIYSMIVLRRARWQTLYRPVFEDWLWFVILPFVVYAVLAAAAIFLRIATQTALFVIGGAALGLLFIGIHNAWDSVTYVVANRHGDATGQE